MYPYELDCACQSVMDVIGTNKDTLGQDKYKELREYIEALAAVHYSKGHDDGYSMHAGYKVN